jgi:hypothetical protein
LPITLRAINSVVQPENQREIETETKEFAYVFMGEEASRPSKVSNTSVVGDGQN